MATARITQFQAELFKKYIAAKQTDNWDFPDKFQGNKEDLISKLKEGKTFKKLWEEIEFRYCSVSALLMASPEVLNHIDSSYRKSMLKGFKELCNNLGIV